MKKKNKVQEKMNRDGFIEVPTYLFPQGEEYAEEVIKDSKRHNKKNTK